MKTDSESDEPQARNRPTASGDTLLGQALERAERGLKEETVPLQVNRHWRTPADSSIHSVTYRPDTGSGRRLAVVDGVPVSLDDPCRLLPVEIDKPWGREIWYTGMEARGESRVAVQAVDVDAGLRAENHELGLGTYLALAPDHLTKSQTPILLKILDPSPTPVLGELYLEVHATKQEVYVVTAVDAEAWPDGQGRIRYGIDQARRGEFADDDTFRAAFLTALGEYEAIRRDIDAGVAGLSEREARARAACLTFTDARNLEVGDVIQVPTWVPHSLQPGVRVVEFQTPTYERFILSSSQQVLTQENWDSAHAVEHMRLDTPAAEQPESIGKGCERIVDFEDFGVWRACLNDGDSMTLPEDAPYAVAFCITGQACLEGPSAGLRIDAGEAALIPASSIGLGIRAEPECLLLLAAPGL